MKEQIMDVFDLFGYKYSISEDERNVYFSVKDHIVTSYVFEHLCELGWIFVVDATLCTNESVTIAFSK